MHRIDRIHFEHAALLKVIHSYVELVVIEDDVVTIDQYIAQINTPESLTTRNTFNLRTDVVSQVQHMQRKLTVSKLTIKE